MVGEGEKFAGGLCISGKSCTFAACLGDEFPDGMPFCGGGMNVVGVNKVHGDDPAFRVLYFRRQAEDRFFLRK